MRVKGKITKWNDDKGFGFIKPNAGGNQTFLHISAFHVTLGSGLHSSQEILGARYYFQQ